MPRMSQHFGGQQFQFLVDFITKLSIGCTIHLNILEHIGRTIYWEVNRVNEKNVKEFVKKRYGEIAKNEGLENQSCGCNCMPSTTEMAKKIGYSQNDLKIIPDSANMGLGCGNPIAFAKIKEGETVVDLGSGGGIDVFLAAKKVGKKGKVIGIDMTQEMISKAKINAEKNNYKNVEFKLGEIEKIPLENDSVDVIISNCVINLSPNKEKVFREAYRILKTNGRILISDIVLIGKLPEKLKQSYVAWAYCVSGALEKEKYLEIIKNAGFQSVKIVSEATFSFDVSKELMRKIASIQVEAKKLA